MVASPVVRPVRPTRVESPARWEKALARALDAGIDALYVGGHNELYAVESQTRPGVVFLVAADGRSCTCEAAAAGDPVCAHRALVRYITNTLEPEPPTPAAPCGTCDGRGYVVDPDGLRRPERCCCPAGVLRPAA